MTFTQLRDFIEKRMRMSHIYQPVMLLTLLRSRGRCTDEKIAKAILPYDRSQIDYYRAITNTMVGRVLRKHGIVAKARRHYTLVDFDKLAPVEIETLAGLCKEKLSAYLRAHGERAFIHRDPALGYISGTLRYEVLKHAAFRCELCGTPADERALEVDHIIPRSKGGRDDLTNLQALCYACNAMKRDRDTTDFRAVRISHLHRETECPFCQLRSDRIVAENKLAMAIRDSHPVTELHTLVIPKRHLKNYFSMSTPELRACDMLLRLQSEAIAERDKSVAGFNIGMNAGAAAGQTVFHAHIHLIPRRTGDVPQPRGGIRNVVPGRGNY